MKISSLHCWLALLCLASAPPLRAANPYRILVTGDSIAVGYTDLPNWNTPFNFGARSGLYTRLTNSGMAVQFVGGSAEPWNGGSAGTYAIPTNAPALDLRPLGQDHHEGYGGKRTDYILPRIAGWLTNHSPDIVLLMIGINDVHATDPTATAKLNLSNIVFTVTATAPQTRLIVAQITPYWTNCPSVVEYNTYIRATLVPYFASLGKHVTTVNQYTNFCFPGTTNIDGALFSNGINHPGLVVYDRMAQTWFDGIQALMPLPPPQEPPPATAARWSGAANGVWDTNTWNWTEISSGLPTRYWDDAPGAAIQFDDNLAGNPEITLTNIFMPASVTFSNHGPAYAVSGGGRIICPGLVLKLGTNTVTVNTSNTFNGGVTVGLGTLVLNGVNTCSTVKLTNNAIVRPGNSSALGSGTISIGVAGNLESCHIELTGGITLTNALAPRVRNTGAPDLTGYFVNVSGTNYLSPPTDLAVSAGGNTAPLQSDSGLLVLTKGVNNAGRFLTLLGAGAGEIQGALGLNTWLVKLGAGQWTLSGSSPTGGPTVVSNGTLVVTGSLTNPTNLVTIAGGTLAGTGVIAGAVTVQAAGTLSPGNALGPLTFAGNLTLQGTAVMEIARNGLVLTNDLVTGIKTNTYGGTLEVRNSGSSRLQVGDSFKLFAATNYAGVFANIVYPAGYTFSNSLIANGTITVLTVPPPAVPAFGISCRMNGGHLLIQFSGGTNDTYDVLASTNITLPILAWPVLGAAFRLSGNTFQFTDVGASNYLARYYCIRLND